MVISLGWKRFLLAEAPRQIVNGIALFNVYVVNGQFRIKQFYANGDTIMASIMFGLMTFTFCVWAISALLLAFAGILYVPLLCQIRGNLKEYVCHKIDKRLAQLLRNKSRKRILEERREQLRLAQEMQALPGANTTTLLPTREPTLPQMGLLDSNQEPPMQQRQPPPPHSQNAVMILPVDKRLHPAVYNNTSDNYAHPHPQSSVSYHPASQQPPSQPYPMSAHSTQPYGGGTNNHHHHQSPYDNASLHGRHRRADSIVSSNSDYSQSRPNPGMDGGNGMRPPPVPPVPPQHMTTSHSYIASIASGRTGGQPPSSSSHYAYDREIPPLALPSSPSPHNEADIRDDISESSYAYSSTDRPAVEEYNSRPLPRPPQPSQPSQPSPKLSVQTQQSTSHSTRPLPPHSNTSNQSARSPTQSSFGGSDTQHDPHRYPYKNIYDHQPRDTPDSPMSTVHPLRLPPPPSPSTLSTASYHLQQSSNEGYRYGANASGNNNGGVATTSSHSANSNSAAYYKASEDRYHQSPTRSRVQEINEMDNDDNDGEPTFSRYNDRGRYAVRHYNHQHQTSLSSGQPSQLRRPGNSQSSQHGSRNHGGDTGAGGGHVYF
jgi:hypothetical protein